MKPYKKEVPDMKYFKYFVGSFVIIIAIVTIAILIKPNPTYNTESYVNFVAELESSGFKIKQEDVDKDILAGQRKWLTVDDNENISVYIYKNNKRMVKDASHVSPDGFSYKTGFKNVSISWISNPHFFKRDNIIVLYVGEDKDIINHLENLLGKQFAGA